MSLKGLRQRVVRGFWVGSSLAVLLGMALAGCGGSDGAVTPPPDDGGGPLPTTQRTVTGFVGDASTGQGLAGVTVQIGGASVQTSANGQFTVPNVVRTSQAVNISANGYLAQSFTLGANTDTVSIRLVPAGVGPVEPPPAPINP